MHFNDPCNLSKLSLSFYAPDGTLYDFNGINHSFILEISTIDERPPHTGIISTSGREY